MNNERNEKNQKNNQNTETKENPLKGAKEKPQRRFSPPSVEDVAAYCRERGNRVNAQAFVDFYASKGWKVGNAPMKDWQAAARNWAKRDRASPSQPKAPKVVREQQYDQRQYANSPDIPDWMMQRWRESQTGGTS